MKIHATAKSTENIVQYKGGCVKNIIVPKGTVAMTTQSSVFKVQNLLTIYFLLISSVMLETYFPDCDSHFEENKTQ